MSDFADFIPRTHLNVLQQHVGQQEVAQVVGAGADLEACAIASSVHHQLRRVAASGSGHSCTMLTFQIKL